MVVKVSKPELNLREKISELDKPSGVAGEAMLRADTVQEARDSINAGRKNLIINGDFRISQRGTYTSATNLTQTSTYYLDRWKFYAFVGTSGTFQHKLDQELPDGSYANTHLHTSTSADLNAPLVQMIEDHKVIWGKHFTVSFWYKTNKETYYNIWNGTSQIHSLIPNSHGAWAKWEQTYKLKENGAHFRLEFYGHTIDMSSGSYLELANIQVELGKVATDFEHRSYGEELALCQRYYQVVEAHNRFRAAGTSHIYTNTLTYFVEMRATPSITKSGGIVSNIGLEATNSVTSKGLRYELTNTSAGDAYQLGRSITLDAEI